MDTQSGAAEYEVTLHFDAAFNATATELRLAVDYDGDAARVFYNGKLLTDNWYSGYRGDGQCEVGISYLSGASEGNAGLMQDGAKLTLQVLPLKETTLESMIWLQPQWWPDVDPQTGIALNVSAIRPLALEYTELRFL